ncbi:MAG: hypothetical protein IT260_01005, partial [Saprospiraceae bacterium]|nr:hypothetical protein [Saprospiraceae bacterium]
MENNLYRGKYSPLPVYEAVKNYFLFYFPDFLPVYYSSKEISALHEIISNKDEGLVFEKWKALLVLIKAKYPSFTLQNFKSRRPSHTVKILISANEHTEINVYLSISLLGKFYALFLEEKRQDETIQYISPFGIHETLLEELESLVESIFSEYVFICFSLLSMNFF